MSNSATVPHKHYSFMRPDGTRSMTWYHNEWPVITALRNAAQPGFVILEEDCPCAGEGTGSSSFVREPGSTIMAEPAYPRLGRD